jgi:hypothetical protein
MLKRMALIALVSVSLAGAKNYRINLSETCQLGSTTLKAGEYTVKLDGDKVVLVDRAGRSTEATAKVESSDRKFDQTAIGISKAGGSPRLQWITLGGSKSRLVFE